MYSIVVYIPLDTSEKVKAAMFKAGAGRIGNYDSCCWQVEGQGQFRPNNNAKPTIGSANELECVAELRVELICDDQYLSAVIAALLKAHPYEEPAYHYWKVNSDS